MVKILVRGKSWTLTAAALLTVLFYHNLLRIYYMSKIDYLRKNVPQLSKKEAEEAGFSYVFYATSSSYACSALVNIHQLQTLGSIVPIHVLVSDKVPQIYMEAFEAAGVTTHLEMSPKLPLSQDEYYQDCLLKLLVFKMHTLDPSLKRVLLFDSDQLILKHFDHLFYEIPRVDLAAPRAYWLRAEQAVFSSAFMLINLSDRLWDKVNKTLPASGGPGGAESKVDMDIMNDELGDTATVLSGEYVTLNSHWEDWDLPNWYHPELRKNSSHIQSNSPVKKAAKLRRPTRLDDDTESILSGKVEMVHSEDSEIYQQLVELYEYTPIIHFTALGKPWMFSAEEVTQHRQDAHPAFAHQFDRWRTVAEQVCPEGYLVPLPGAAEEIEEIPTAGLDPLNQI